MPRQRYDHARELREIARKLEQLPQITHRVSADAAHEAKRELVREIRDRADNLVRMDEPSPETVFSSGRGKSAGGRPFVAERRA